MAMDLPEIPGMIAAHLGKSDLLSCMRVSKEWGTKFEPEFWRSFTLQQQQHDHGPTIELMENKAHFIRELTLRFFSPVQHETFFNQCSNLNVLRIEFSLSPQLEPTDKSWLLLTHLLQPGLRSVALASNEVMHLSIKFLSALSRCTRLTTFDVKNLVLDNKATALAFVNATAPSVRRLVVKDVSFPKGFAFPQGLVFSEATSLTMINLNTHGVAHQFEWLKRCPNLKSIVWEGDDKTPIGRFCKEIPTACQKLTDLNLWKELSDDEIARVLNAIPKVERLTMGGAPFGQMSRIALRRHGPTLVDIDFRSCPSVTSPMVHEILSSCPNLLSIKADRMLYGDAISKPWVCTKLRHFDVGLAMWGRNIVWKNPFPTSAQQRFYECLAELTDLEYLSICDTGTYTTDTQYMVELSRKAGVHLLAPLKKLRFFSCKVLLVGTMLRSDIRILEWMLEHWKNLKTFEGSLFGYATNRKKYNVDIETSITMGWLKNKVHALMSRHGVQFVDYMMTFPKEMNELEWQCEDFRAISFGDNDHGFDTYRLASFPYVGRHRIRGWSRRTYMGAPYYIRIDYGYDYGSDYDLYCDHVYEFNSRL
ncbi:hypothetical protein BGZ51_003855 [Haplosporangium sp. Z 767]|nr:hypothetical protein BGZ50_008040 [Haplosporangium sp. Z 11]KAF9183678.1 hypothetical protein BGZ51_003855 [Haplosporangium sp. Z 767]